MTRRKPTAKSNNATKIPAILISLIQIGMCKAILKKEGAPTSMAHQRTRRRRACINSFWTPYPGSALNYSTVSPFPARKWMSRSSAAAARTAFPRTAATWSTQRTKSSSEMWHMARRAAPGGSHSWKTACTNLMEHYKTVIMLWWRRLICWTIAWSHSEISIPKGLAKGEMRFKIGRRLLGLAFSILSCPPCLKSRRCSCLHGWVWHKLDNSHEKAQSPQS